MAAIERCTLKVLLGLVTVVAIIAIGCAETTTPADSPESPPTANTPTVTTAPATAIPPTTDPPTAVPQIENTPTPLPPTATPPSADPPAPDTAPEPIGLSGAGDFLSSPFELQQGVLVVFATHDGSSNFVVSVIPEVGTGSALSTNTIGSYEGTRAHTVDADAFIGLKPGAHRVEVTADGNWAMEITRPAWAQGESIPLSRSGKGDGIVGPITLEAGTVPLKATHDGSSNFIVTVFSADGKNQDLPVNEIGSYDGSQAIRVLPLAIIGLEPGVHVVVIQADGNWTVDIGD